MSVPAMNAAHMPPQETDPVLLTQEERPRDTGDTDTTASQAHKDLKANAEKTRLTLKESTNKAHFNSCKKKVEPPIPVPTQTPAPTQGSHVELSADRWNDPFAGGTAFMPFGDGNTIGSDPRTTALGGSEAKRKQEEEKAAKKMTRDVQERKGEACVV